MDLTLIYDGDCGFCRRWVNWTKSRDLGRRIEYVACQSKERAGRFPEIPEEDCLKAMYAVLSDRRVFSGADAAAQILRVLPGFEWPAALFQIPGVMLAARPIYRFIARRRGKLGCGPDP